ncbi:hypothetical protein NP233_g1241 [Leucocoprinus birnbaumii]|uniref:WD40 repeat-like protein n=1 Tax=Leucocoprinus birnbaumii TaxID=56174 RepID=A0AAD5YW12_9AGAR|nr:hypothetical protein NP233_g1241 [Leucocoprinus birnbaumii]
MDAPPIHITADEINCLIYSYLNDSGFTHSAFTLCNEGSLQSSPWFHKHIPRGELVELLSKALLYLEVESHWQGNELITSCKNKFSLLEHHVCSNEPPSPVPLKSPSASSTTTRLLPSVKAPKTLSSDKDASTSRETQVIPISTQSFYGTTSSIHTNGTLTPSDALTKRKGSPIAIDGPAEKRAKREPDDMDVDVATKTDSQSLSNAIAVPKSSLPISHDADAGKLARPRINPPVKSPDNKAIMMLPGHRTEVFLCSFNPKRHSQLASGSKDAVVNFWNLPDPPASESEAMAWNGQPITVDNHVEGVPGDMTTLTWNMEGTLLAIGSYDTVLRIFTSDGGSYFTHNQHRGPIFSVRFSPNGRWLVSASLDETTCLFNVKEKRLVRQYRCHQDCCLDAEWLDDTTFVTAGADGNIYVMKIDEPEPIKRISGHTDEINQLKCNPSRTRLASCSDDNTARVWNVEKIEPDTETDESIPGLGSTNQVIIPVVLSGHTHSVSMMGWTPSQKSGGPELLATSSFDCTVRIWDPTTGQCVKLLEDHARPVYTLTFSPDGKWLATGSGDGWVHVYWIKTWEKRWSWSAGHSKRGVFEIAWQMVQGINRLAVALESRMVAIVDVSKVPALRDPEPVLNGNSHGNS